MQQATKASIRIEDGVLVVDTINHYYKSLHNTVFWTIDDGVLTVTGHKEKWQHFMYHPWSELDETNNQEWIATVEDQFIVKEEGYYKKLWWGLVQKWIPETKRLKEGWVKSKHEQLTCYRSNLFRIETDKC